MPQYVRLDVEGGVGTIRLDRPKMNALDFTLQEEIRIAADAAAERDDVVAVVVYGGAKVFAAGADIVQMASMGAAEMGERGGVLQACLTAVATIPKPTVAAITGYALGGGCELALCTDVRFAADDARLGQPEILLGIIPGAGGTQRLSRLVGPAVAKELMYTGRFVAADEALRIGLVDRVLPAAEVYESALAWARQFVGAASLALAAIKRSVDQGLDEGLQAGLEIERAEFSALFDTADQKTGMQSFIDNGPGKAVFEGR